MTTIAIAAQKIVYAKNEVMKAGEKYNGKNGATVLITSFWKDSEGGLMVAYSAMHPDLTGGKWMSGDKTPNSMYHWIFPQGQFAA